MKKSLLLFFVLFYISASAQHQGIGLRVGDPSGITYKRYLPNSLHALEFALGSTQPGRNQSYYQNSFDEYDKFDNMIYQSHSVESTLYLQGRYLKQYPFPIEGVEGSFEWYWGIGALFKIAKVNYRYRDTDANFYRDVVTDVDFGPEIPLGMEYTFQDVPLTVFSELSIVIELTDRPGILLLKGAVGIRYNFFKNL
jgi:hypothetical protein